VQVNSAGSINEGIGLAKDSGSINVAAGTYSDDIIQSSIYSRDLTLTGNDGAVTKSITLDKDVNGKISGLRATTLNVNSGASIQDGITLAKTSGTVSVASGAGTGQTVNYNKDVYLAGLGSDVLNTLTLSLNGVGKISGFTAGTVNVGALAKIQQGIDLATATGTVTLATSHDYGETVNYNKAVTMNGNGAATSDLTLSVDGTGKIGSFTASTVNVGTSAKVQQGINLAASSGTVNVAAGAYSENVILDKTLKLVGSGLGATATSFTLNSGASLLSGTTGVTSSTINVNSGAKIQDGITLASSGGTVNVASGAGTGQTVNYNKAVSLIGSDLLNTLTLSTSTQGITGLTAGTINVGSSASINYGLSLAANNGAVNVAAGTYSDDVTQSFYSRGITLTGATGAIANSITLDRAVNSKISGLTASTVQVNSGASIDEGIDLAKVGGAVNVATGVGTGKMVTYDKAVYLTGSDVLNALTLSLDGTGKISGFAANTVNVASTNAKIQHGIDLATSGGTVNVAAGTYYENLNINKALTLNGAGSDQTTVDGQDLGSVITVGAGATNNLISNIRVTNGNAAQGGGISNEGSLTLQNVEISNNNAEHGGGVINTNGGSLTLEGVNIHGNAATGMGGGVYNDKSTSVLIMNSGSITYNTASDGAGICNGGTLNLNGGSIAHNSASSRGGGIGNWVTLSLSGTTITDNTAVVSGGGIFSQSGTVTLISGSVTGNGAPIGSGIAYKTGTVTGDNGLVTGNTGGGSQIQQY